MVKQNVKVKRYVTADKPLAEWDQPVYTYEHPEYLPEGTVVVVDLRGYAVEGEIVYDNHAYDGKCKPILEVLSLPPSVVVV